MWWHKHNPPLHELHVTLWPSSGFPHFQQFGADRRLTGIRLNSAMMEASEIDNDFEQKYRACSRACWFDVKGMQLRIREVIEKKTHVEFILNRPVKVKTPTEILFKAGEDSGIVTEIKNGTHFIFENPNLCPHYEVRAGESIHIRGPHEVGGPVILDYEKEKIDKVRKLGIKHFYLSYVYDTHHIEALREIIGPDPELILKIENKQGLVWAIHNFHSQRVAARKFPHTHLAAARGDLFVEVDRPHEIMQAVRKIVEVDPEAIVGSRMLLSMIHQSVPSCADLSDLAWLADIGYKRFLLCDELCLKGDLLEGAVNVFDAFRETYR